MKTVIRVARTAQAMTVWFIEFLLAFTFATNQFGVTVEALNAGVWVRTIFTSRNIAYTDRASVVRSRESFFTHAFSVLQHHISFTLHTHISWVTPFAVVNFTFNTLAIFIGFLLILVTDAFPIN